MSNAAPPLPKVTWMLVGQTADDTSLRTTPIDNVLFTVGRRADQHLYLASPTVSGRHAELVVEGEELRIRDLGSTNGTFINGERIYGESNINHGDLVQFAQVVFRVTRQDQTTNQSQTLQHDSADRAFALIQFDKLITERAVVPHYQPIITLKDRQLIGHEVLGRSRLFGMTTPATMFQAASLLNLEGELSRILREEGLLHAEEVDPRQMLFVNTHPNETEEPELLEFSLRELRAAHPNRPIVLEIHEATATQTHQMRELRARLNDLDIGLAYDDFGAGQARLIELVEVPPDYLKFDMKLVQNLHAASAEHQKMVERLVQMTTDLGIRPLAEGVELLEDHEVCLQIGFHSGQGYLYGKPAPVTCINERASRTGPAC